MKRFFILSSGLILAALVLPVGSTRAQTSATWKQHVHYEMDVHLVADHHQMHGTQRLEYTNNSPDTLHQVFYHLYFNAFNPHSMMAERNRDLPDPDGRVVPRIWNLGPDEVGYHHIHNLTQDGQPVTFHVDDTIMQVMLAKPIPPGATSVFEMTFDSQVPLQTRRSGWANREGVEFSMSQWYPKMVEYDERGWHADPYVGREFYGVYGTFDVHITLPANYVVGATGVLQNPDEIGHGYQADTTATYTYDPADSLTWNFHAENVHDFAWAADPDFVHEQIDGGNGITYHLLYQHDVAPQWKMMSEWVPQIIEYYSERFGRYPYPQFTVAQAGDGGMEYPMMNFITGRRPPISLLGVTAHEAAHEWFYGVLGSNESDYSWMDEGFTSWASSEGFAHVLGRPPSHRGAILGVVSLQKRGLFERLNTPADWYTTNTAFSIASYPGGETLVDLLGYVVSDSLRDAWLREYFRRFKFRHPNPFDLEKIAEDVTGIRLDWYFEQIANTTRKLDYELEGLTSVRDGNRWRTTVQLERENDVVMPADVRLTLADGSTQWVNVPLGIMHGRKPVGDDWIQADPWYWTNPEYTLTVSLPQRVVRAEIDPLARTPDVNRLNNTSGFSHRVDFLQPPSPAWGTYGIGIRPMAQYASDYGFAAGVQARGSAFFGEHRVQAAITIWPQVLFSSGDDPSFPGSDLPDTQTSFFDGIDYELSYSSTAPSLGGLASFSLASAKHLGVMETTASVTKQFGADAAITGRGPRATLALRHLFVPSDRAYRIDVFSPFLRENMLSATFDVRIADGQDFLALGGEVGASFRNQLVCTAASGGRGSCFGAYRQRATDFHVEGQKTAVLGPFDGSARLKLGLGVETLALHKRFRLGAATAEQAWRDDAFRSVSAAFDNALSDAQLAAFDGAGPVAYLLGAADGNDPRIRVVGGTPIGTSILEGSIRLGYRPFTANRWLRPIRVEAFSGAGTVWGSSSLGAAVRPSGFSLDDVVADAGLGLSFDVSALRQLSRWTRQSDVLSGLRVAARFPLWASDPDLIDRDQNAVAFRWLVGIEVGR